MEGGLLQCSANYMPLSPISFLEGAATVYGGKVSIVYGTTTYSWRQTHERCLKMASALFQLGISRGDIVVALAPNVPALYELHFSVPMAGAVLSALNTRLDSATLALILEQLEAKMIFVDYQFVEVVLEAFNHLSHKKGNLPPLVLVPECDQASSSMAKEPPQGSLDYNRLIAMGQSGFEIKHPNSECDPISVNYTSGSTGKPKGVIYSHRAVYLKSLGEILRSDMRHLPVFLWTVDMFRCNGWCFPWAVAAVGGTNICLRNVSAKAIFDAISLHKVTHLCGAPTLLSMIAEAIPTHHRPLPHKVDIVVAGAVPPSQVLNKIQELGFNLTHAYGMTEALGPVIASELSSLNENSKFKHREGIHALTMEGVDVKNPTTMTSVPCDGETIGEVMLRGNTMMLGYFKNLQATQEALRGGWYRTGDLGVVHPDGHIQMKDRAIDKIISGGETISTLEVEAVLVSHPMVSEAAVVGRPDDHLGETPCAFVKLKDGCNVSSEEIIEFCGKRLSRYMAPRTVYFGDLPVNSTGKVQKFVLREKAKAKGCLSLYNRD
ncbi:butanoate--CoA ligase AAE1-like [Cornus florida]|uniref:butanoate--CoA ligase AAE1-like n=1 Tax=Cornus florida TaxID=4283 RepID=UPI00289E02B5|nr:butanoate--CoA ligase AAE1-like [Cornus florida]